MICLIFFIRIFSIRTTRKFFVVGNKLDVFFQQHIYFLLKTLEDDSLYLSYKLNRSILMIGKYSESLLLVFCYCEHH